MRAFASAAQPPPLRLELLDLAPHLGEPLGNCRRDHHNSFRRWSMSQRSRAGAARPLPSRTTLLPPRHCLTTRAPRDHGGRPWRASRERDEERFACLVAPRLLAPARTSRYRVAALSVSPAASRTCASRRFRMCHQPGRRRRVGHRQGPAVLRFGLFDVSASESGGAEPGRARTRRDRRSRPARSPRALGSTQPPRRVRIAALLRQPSLEQRCRNGANVVVLVQANRFGDQRRGCRDVSLVSAPTAPVRADDPAPHLSPRASKPRRASSASATARSTGPARSYAKASAKRASAVSQGASLCAASPRARSPASMAASRSSSSVAR